MICRIPNSNFLYRIGNLQVSNRGGATDSDGSRRDKVGCCDPWANARYPCSALNIADRVTCSRVLSLSASPSFSLSLSLSLYSLSLSLSLSLSRSLSRSVSPSLCLSLAVARSLPLSLSLSLSISHSTPQLWYINRDFK